MRSEPTPEVTARLQGAVERLLAGGTTYAEIGIDALVDEAGMAKSTFYVYFEDKDALLRTLAAQVIAALIAVEDAWWSLPPDASKDALRDAVTTMVDEYRGHGPLLAAVTEAAIYDPRMHEQFTAAVGGASVAAAARLRQAGVADAERVAFWLTWMFERGLYLLLLPADARRRKRRIAAFTEILWGVLHGGRG
ncbi:MAG TPA: TetR/AcrR family transcriptional regulator [Solirubrobacteraceae bacterium]